MTNESSASRRRFFKITAIGLAAAPFASALMSGAAHAAAVPVKETDPTAAALGYVADATKSTKRTDKAAMCSTCSLYSGKAGAADGPCTIFQGNLVSAKGWCTAWVKKA